MGLINWRALGNCGVYEKIFSHRCWKSLNLGKRGLGIVDINYWNLNRYGIIAQKISISLEKLPFKLTSIILGPKLPQKELNKTLLRLMLRRKENALLNVPILQSRNLSYR